MSRIDGLVVRRLNPADRRLAQRTFEMMSAVFAEERGARSDRYVDDLLSRPDFWALAALDREEPVGGSRHTSCR